MWCCGCYYGEDYYKNIASCINNSSVSFTIGDIITIIGKPDGKIEINDLMYFRGYHYLIHAKYIWENFIVYTVTTDSYKKEYIMYAIGN